MPKRRPPAGFGCCGIGPDDFEIRGRAERDQRVPRALTRMLSAWRRLYAEQLFRRVDAELQIGRRVNEMIDLRQHAGRRWSGEEKHGE